MITSRKVNFLSRGINVVGNLYLSSSSTPNRKRAAIIVGHPGTGIKEQASGLYAQRLAEFGFVTLAFDAAYQGESGGEPHGLEDPSQRVEDFKNVVTFLSTLNDEVDPERIGFVGICASGGYGISAAATDLRMKAVATVSCGCWGRLTRDSTDRATLQQALAQAGRDRIAEAKGSQPAMLNILDVFGDEAKEYYKTPRGEHPGCTNEYPTRSVELMAGYDSFTFIEWISPRPLLMIVGSEAGTVYLSRQAIERAEEPKELFVIEGKKHMDLYDDTSESVPKLVDFMAKSLCT
ncbi:hypothetical protein MRS44_011987 [Fusarium solani]|uniref:Hydrolase of the alpha/beta superfamily n=1 Tax=Fusarium solani TaxID=169388 RepID=A0A9P9G1N4_FUSSL|nr:hydrolase of the alpha/beta superfamily [Fusarium solani]KAH7230327.1 hydrolase of the alpha/beta superfamily [Fusarium solani]KAJ3461120.1 hypothetical protein MRS44_011987 [Fusarium solani]